MKVYLGEFEELVLLTIATAMKLMESPSNKILKQDVTEASVLVLFILPSHAWKKKDF